MPQLRQIVAQFQETCFLLIAQLGALLFEPSEFAFQLGDFDERFIPACFEFTGHQGVVFCVAWHPDGKLIASSGWNDERKLFVVTVWDARTGRTAYSLPAVAETYAVAFSHDGNYLITGGSSRAVRVWDARTGHEVGTLGTHDREIGGLAVSGDGRHLASLGGEVKVCEVQTWKAAFVSADGDGDGNQLAYSPDGQLLAVASSDAHVTVLEATTGR